jgi:hypothetical protein
MSTDTDFGHDAAQVSTDTAMRKAGVPVTEVVQVDYFDFEVTRTVTLPDGISFVEHKELTEGQRKKYLNSINRDVIVHRQTGDARMRMAPGDERHALLLTAISGWNLKRAGQALPFNEANVKKFLDAASPRVIDLIDKEVRKANAWLIQDMSVEDIDKEIETLQELRATKVEEESGNSAS